MRLRHQRREEAHQSRNFPCQAAKVELNAHHRAGEYSILATLDASSKHFLQRSSITMVTSSSSCVSEKNPCDPLCLASPLSLTEHGL